ncbi:hypothetical protein [Neobacillus vireti]
MSYNVENSKDSRSKSSYAVQVFIGAGIGALLGLIAYVKDWF